MNSELPMFGRGPKRDIWMFESSPSNVPIKNSCECFRDILPHIMVVNDYLQPFLVLLMSLNWNRPRL